MYGDSAYNDREEINKRKGEVEIVAKIPGAVNKNGFYTKDDFNIDMENGTIECPEKETAIFEQNAIPKSGRTVCFDSETCNNCKEKDKCTKSNNGRTVSINANEAEILEAKAFQKTDEFKEDYANRSHVERTISDVTKHGIRQARFIGVEKTKFQLLLSVINHNMKKFMRHINIHKLDVLFNM